jgi:hypothetical protein
LKINKGVLNYYFEINLSKLIIRSNGMSVSSERVKRWRERTKKRIVEAMGGMCVCCGYNDCYASMDLHHLNSSEKEFSFNNIRANPKRWSKIVTELRKCVIVCCRCHHEIHAGFRVIPNDVVRFNENFAEYREIHLMDICPICGEQKYFDNKTCSYKCAAKLSRKVDWDNIDLKEILKTKTISMIADELNVSWNAVKKRIKKLGLV